MTDPTRAEVEAAADGGTPLARKLRAEIAASIRADALRSLSVENQALRDALTAARRAEAAAWNDAIEAAAEKCDVASMDHIGDIVRGIGDEIRALRRAAPTEGEA